MKRSILFSSVLCLLLGLLIGSLLPAPWDKPSVPSVPVLSNSFSNSAPSVSNSVGTQTTPDEISLDTSDNFPLLNAACAVVRALRQEDYSTVASFVHPTKGVTFTPYSTVEPGSDRVFSRDEIMNLTQDSTVYTWGTVDGRGSSIELTMEDYFSRYVFNADYTQAPQIGVDRILMHGNALENLKEAYPQGRFVDFCCPQMDEASEGLDWCSLKLVFEPVDAHWRLVGVVHGEWTI